MVTWADTDSAIQAERLLRTKRVESMAMYTAFAILGCAVWLAWPTLKSMMQGDGVVLANFGPPFALILWGIFLQDLVLDDPSARTRLGSSTALAWPVLLVIGALGIDTDSNQALAGSLLVLFTALVARNMAVTTLRGHFGVLRFRAILTGIGSASALALVVTQVDSFATLPGGLAAALAALACGDTVYSWSVGDDQKVERKAFQRRLDRLEGRLLELKAQGAAVAQAASLLTTAKEEGHLDPVYGMRLLDESEEDMERSLSFADDVEIIRRDALDAIEKAESIAPVVKRPRKAYEMGMREVGLGSLREGEQLFRQSKKRAGEVIEWWKQAEDAITEAVRALDGKKGDGIATLRDLLKDAKEKLSKEQPREAFEFAVVIPEQLEAEGEAQDRAVESIKEAHRQLNQSDGLDLKEGKQRLKKAENALEEGNASQAIGLADGVVRTLQRERAAMDDVLRALKQRKQLVKRYEGRDDEATWGAALAEIERAADQRSWSHAGMLLERMTTDLDKEGRASGEALELYDYVMDEWKVLRNQCEAAGITITDEDRRACEEAIALSEEMLGVSRIEECLQHLSQADAAMERLRRRI